MTIYADITNIPELSHYTGISRVVSEVAVRFIENGNDICLIAYDNQRKLYQIINKDEFISCHKGLQSDKKRCYTGVYIEIADFEKNSVFFDMNSCWHTMPNRSYLLPKLKENGVRVAVLIYDLIPIRYPQFMVDITLLRFMEFLSAHLTYADDIVVTTNAVRDDVSALMSELKIPEKPFRVIGLGADFSDIGVISEGLIDPEIARIADRGKFLLTVGSVEPRKNHKVMIEAYEKHLADTDVSLIIVGKIGWDIGDLIVKIKSSPNYNNGLYLLEGINDATLNYLYSKAFTVLFASYIEGYGLPTVEAMINGSPVICSDIPVMHEVGGDFCDYFPPNDAERLAEIIKSYLTDSDLYSKIKKRLSTEYIPPKWSETMKQLRQIFDEKPKFQITHKPIKQIVFLSARPKPLLETLPFIEEYMSFLTELVVCCPSEMADFLTANYRGKFKLITVTDEQLLKGHPLPADHSTRNFFLRCLAMQCDKIDNEFIMCDDDYRPLHPISEEFFFQDGKYNCYYFSNIAEWRHHIAHLYSYDMCHFRTLGFLKKHGFPTFQYSSHQPQVINKTLYTELLEKFPGIEKKGYDEWSTYFNFCSAEYPELFRPMLYRTLSWPNIGGENRGYEAPDYVFENYYESNYTSGGAFFGLPRVFTNSDDIQRSNAIKIEIAETVKANFASEHAERSVFFEEYKARYGELPQFSVHFQQQKNNAVILGVPREYILFLNGINKIRFYVSHEKQCRANIMPSSVILELKNLYGDVYASASENIEQQITSMSLNLRIPKNQMPPEISKELFLEITVETACEEPVKKVIPINTVLQ